MSNAIIAKVDYVKDYLGIPLTSAEHDRRITQLMGAAQPRLESYLKKKLVLVAAESEQFFGGGGARYYTKFYPIVSVASIVDPATNTLDPDNYLVIGEQGYVQHLAGSFPRAVETTGKIARWTITYAHGLFATVAAVTDEYKQALSLLVAERFERIEPGVMGKSLGGSISVTYSDHKQLVPDEVAALVGSQRSLLV